MKINNKSKAAMNIFPLGKEVKYPHSRAYYDILLM